MKFHFHGVRYQAEDVHCDCTVEVATIELNKEKNVERGWVECDVAQVEMPVIGGLNRSWGKALKDLTDMVAEGK